ncbi:hypothetical protein ENHY17A_170076 [Moraxellaceae bacterium 17A]|nr:hypothetical protein ENHY17A_170076 [Moraxellaceae bacterium 17A]
MKGKMQWLTTVKSWALPTQKTPLKALSVVTLLIASMKTRFTVQTQPHLQPVKSAIFSMTMKFVHVRVNVNITENGLNFKPFFIAYHSAELSLKSSNAKIRMQNQY